jgi:hypothetical protein
MVRISNFCVWLVIPFPASFCGQPTSIIGLIHKVFMHLPVGFRGWSTSRSLQYSFSRGRRWCHCGFDFWKLPLLILLDQWKVYIEIHECLDSVPNTGLASCPPLLHDIQQSCKKFLKTRPSNYELVYRKLIWLMLVSWGLRWDPVSHLSFLLSLFWWGLWIMFFYLILLSHMIGRWDTGSSLSLSSMLRIEWVVFWTRDHVVLFSSLTCCWHERKKGWLCAHRKFLHFLNPYTEVGASYVPCFLGNPYSVMFPRPLYSVPFFSWYFSPHILYRMQGSWRNLLDLLQGCT